MAPVILQTLNLMPDTPSLPLVYLVHREALSAVFSSQVLTLLEEHRDVADITLGLLTPVGHLLRRQYRPALRDIESRCRETGISVGWIPLPPCRVPWLWSETFLLRRWISQRFRKDQAFIVRCRNAQMTCLAMRALQAYPGARVIYDCRGMEVIEFIQRLGGEGQPQSTWKPAIRRAVDDAIQRERLAISRSAGVTCVSYAMARMLQQRYPEVPRDKFRVVPCCPKEESFRSAFPERTAVRQALGLADRFVVAYLGSLAWYQQPQSAFKLFQLIQMIRPDAHFLAITTDPDLMSQLAREVGLTPESYSIYSVPAREVPRLLVAADLGLMLRDESETNRVAAPVKFGEYLAAGVPVIITPNLGDCSECVREHQLGVEVDLFEDDASTTSRLQVFLTAQGTDSSAIQSRCRHYAETELSWLKVVPRLAAWYAELLALPVPNGCGDRPLRPTSVLTD